MLKPGVIRSWAKTWFGLELIVTLAVLLAGLACVPFLWGWYGMAGLLVGLTASAVASAGIFAFLRWMGRDVRSSLPQIHAEHHHKKAEPDGDLTEVASAPVLPPWMGTGP